jgi:hypothetical protein
MLPWCDSDTSTGFVASLSVFLINKGMFQQCLASHQLHIVHLLKENFGVEGHFMFLSVELLVIVVNFVMLYFLFCIFCLFYKSVLYLCYFSSVQSYKSLNISFICTCLLI